MHCGIHKLICRQRTGLSVDAHNAGCRIILRITAAVQRRGMALPYHCCEPLSTDSAVEIVSGAPITLSPGG
jgi:hypothetical protein